MKHPSNSLTKFSYRSQSDSWKSEKSRTSDSEVDTERLELVKDIFENHISISQQLKHLSKGKFREPPPNISKEFEINVEDDSSSSSQEEDNLNNLDDTALFIYSVSQIDPETFDPPIQIDKSWPNEWIILWLMKFQKKFNLFDTAFDTLVKFIRQVVQRYDIKDADSLLTSIFTAKSSLNFSTKYREYGMCQKCFTLYNPTDLKNYTEDDEPSVKKWHHVEFLQHWSKKRQLPCGQPLTQEIMTPKERLLCLLLIYLVGSIKQQLYIMY